MALALQYGGIGDKDWRNELHGVAAFRNSHSSHSLPSLQHLCARQEKTARAAGEHQYGELRAIANSAGNRTGDRGQNSTDAEVLRRIQERGRFAGDSRPRTETARKNAQILDRRETGRDEILATASEVRSVCRKTGRQTVREISRYARNDGRGARATGGASPGITATDEKLITAPGALAGLAFRCAEGPGRRCGCRSLRGPRLFSDDW